MVCKTLSTYCIKVGWTRNEMVLSIYLIDVACGTESQVLHEELQPSLNDVFGGYSKQLQTHLVPFE